jgi:hypothetical protein
MVQFHISPLKSKKLRAVFKDGSHQDFGDSRYEDYTTHKDPKRKERYLKRHEAREDWNDPKTKGSLSRWLLWNLPNLKASIEDYQRRFPDV